MTSNHDFFSLQRVRLFADIDGQSLRAIAEKCVWLRFEPEQQILQTSENSADIFFVIEGVVAVNHFSTKGREVTFTEIDHGGFFGEFSAIDSAPRSANVVAKTDALIARLSPALFRKVIFDHPGIALRLCEHLVGKNRELTKRVFEFSTYDVPERIRLEILRLCYGHGVRSGSCTIDPAPTHYGIATKTSTHREAVSREFSALTRKGVIGTKRKSITVHDVARLRALIADAGEPI
jgi:CRP-like cAMP-binding protein